MGRNCGRAAWAAEVKKGGGFELTLSIDFTTLPLPLEPRGTSDHLLHASGAERFSSEGRARQTHISLTFSSTLRRAIKMLIEDSAQELRSCRAQKVHGQSLQRSWGSHYELITRVEELDAGRCTWHGWAEWLTYCSDDQKL